MDIKQLKENIEIKNIGDDFLVLKWSDNSFLAHQYVQEIAEIKGLKIVYIDSVDDWYHTTSDIFMDTTKDKSLYVCVVDTFSTSLESVEKCKNVIVISKKIDKKCEEIIKNYIVEFPELQDWQILDYMKYKCVGIKEEHLKWLQHIAKNDIYRIDNEINKISIFQKELQEGVFRLINDDNGYSDLCDYTIYNLTNAIIKNDMSSLKDIMCEIENIDVEPMGLVSILCKNLYNIIQVQMNPHATAEMLEVNSKQFYAIKNNCGYFDNSTLRRFFMFINSIDYELKQGNLPIGDKNLIDYVVCNLCKITG